MWKLMKIGRKKKNMALKKIKKLFGEKKIKKSADICVHVYYWFRLYIYGLLRQKNIRLLQTKENCQQYFLHPAASDRY